MTCPSRALRGDVSAAARRRPQLPRQDGVAAAVGAGAVPGARREGAAGAAAAALLLPLLQRAPLPRVRLARGNAGPAAPLPSHWPPRLSIFRIPPCYWLVEGLGGRA